MTKSEVNATIDATKKAISTKIGERAKYSLVLKKAILNAANTIGASQFSKESGLDQSLISQWKRPSTRKKKRAKVGRTGKTGIKDILPNARELMIAQDPVPISTRYGIIRSGASLEIQVPVELLTPEWISQVVGSLNSAKGVPHA